MKKNTILDECTSSAIELIQASQSLLNLNATNSIFEFSKYLQKITEIYVLAIEKFEKLIKELEKENNNQDLIISANDVIIKAENTISQFSIPDGKLTLMPPQKIQIIQSIINSSIPLIKTCEKFIEISNKTKK